MSRGNKSCGTMHVKACLQPSVLVHCQCTDHARLQAQQQAGSCAMCRCCQPACPWQALHKTWSAPSSCPHRRPPARKRRLCRVRCRSRRRLLARSRQAHTCQLHRQQGCHQADAHTPGPRLQRRKVSVMLTASESNSPSSNTLAHSGASTGMCPMHRLQCLPALPAPCMLLDAA